MYLFYLLSLLVIMFLPCFVTLKLTDSCLGALAEMQNGTISSPCKSALPAAWNLVPKRRFLLNSWKTCQEN
jgi:hypothetical protein